MKRKKGLLVLACMLVLSSLVTIEAMALDVEGWRITPRSGFSRNGALCREDANCHVCKVDDSSYVKDHYSRARIVDKDRGNKIMADSDRCYNLPGVQTSYADCSAQNAAIYAGQAFWGGVY